MAVQQLGLHDVYQQGKTLAYGIWRRRWYMILTAWAVCLVVWLFVATLPYRYTATAQIFVDTDTILPTIARNLGVNLDVQRQVDAVRSTLLTRNNLERIIRRTDYLDNLAPNDAETGQLINYLQRNIRVTPLNKGLFGIRFDIDEQRLSDRERAEVAKDVVQSLLNLFIEAKTGDNTQAGQSFLQQQIEDYKNRLDAAEAARAKFRQDNLEFLGGQGGFVSRLSGARTALQGTRNQVAELQVSVDELKTQLDNTSPTIRSATSSRSQRGGVRDPLEERINQQRRTLDQLKANGLKEKHPDVRNVRLLLAQLEEEYAAKQAQAAEDLAQAADDGANSLSATETPNRLYEQLTLQLIEARTQLKTLQQREAQQLVLLNELEAKAKLVPEIEAEQQRLTRDYNSVRGQYRELVEQAQNVELQSQFSSQDAIALQVVEDPVTPKQPSGPPRLLYLTFALFGGLMSGLALALLVSQLRPEIMSVEQLNATFDLPVIGSVTRVLTEAEAQQHMRELLIFLAVGALLFLTYFGFVLADFFGILRFG